ncbi:MAG: copper amine oxidase N-terminal domain-containing protein [Bacillota bacterium]
MKKNNKMFAVILSLATIICLVMTSNAFAAGTKNGNDKKVANNSNTTGISNIQANDENMNSSAEAKTKGDQLKQIREQIRERIRNLYTKEEKDRLKSLEKELKKKYKDIKVLPVDSVITKGAMIKFDTPPVIKEGRILIPVRALTEGFGASVTWDQAKKEVTIQRGEVKIVLQIGNNLAYVNGEEVKIDVPPEIINNRTVVPLRFIAEKLGLKVNWDEESETVEVEEDSQAASTNE